MTSFLGFILPGGIELWVILAIFLLLFGHRIPKMARSMGSGIVEFKRGLKDPDSKDDDEVGGSGGGKITVDPDDAGKSSPQESSSNG